MEAWESGRGRRCGGAGVGGWEMWVSEEEGLGVKSWKDGFGRGRRGSAVMGDERERESIGESVWGL